MKKIGQNSIVKNSSLGEETNVWHNVNIYNSKIGNNCVISSFCEIGGSEIGNNCKVEAFVFMPPGVKVGNNVFIGPRVSFSNDKYPSAKTFGDQRSTVVEDNVSIGIAATILPGIRLGKGCMVGAGAVVTKDVPCGVVVVGVPARVVKNSEREIALTYDVKPKSKIKIASPHIDSDTVYEVINILQSGNWVQGSKVKEFEDEVARYIGTKHAIAVGNGTQALHTSLLAIGVKPGDEIITTPFSFVATVNAILMCDAKPVFVDIDPATFNIDPDLIISAITPQTKAILPVHLYGQPCDIKRLKSICVDHNLALIEDACQAHGAKFKGQKVGRFGDTGCFSFYATKNLACGEGGMITTSDDELARKARLLRAHGKTQSYNGAILGYNYRLSEVAAVIGLSNLKYLDNWNKKRHENAKLFTGLLSDIKGLVTPHIDSNGKHAFHQYTIKVTSEYPLSRDELIDKLARNGVEGKVFYPVPLHKMRHIAKVVGRQKFPVAEQACREVLSLPIHPAISKADLNHIASTIRNV